MKKTLCFAALAAALCLLTACASGGAKQPAGTCTVSVSCRTLTEHPEKLAAEKRELVPEDGWLLEPESVEFYEGESAFDVLLRETKKHKLHMEYSETPLYQSAYIEGIGNLYEFDAGDTSGWVYSVNGWFPNYGCSQYQLADGDEIAWSYTCDLGRDVGAEVAQ